ncbi:two-component system response regulator [Streptomyces sp. NPDC088785]|uniref:response regulator n=1 Tax=Streptomyces sp. NPDC088785 TaxID=3365897 RepID=UPI003819FB68
MGELRPLAHDLPEETRALALALRELFAGLDVSVRRYAIRRERDPGTLSRYLNGTRVPPWHVINELLADVTEHRGSAVTGEAVELLRELYGAAVENGCPPKKAVVVLEEQMADADRLSRRSSVSGDVLGEALLARTHRIADLEVRLTQLEVDWQTERTRADQLEAAHPEVTGLLEEREALKDQVERLNHELQAAREQRAAAEARCELLERQLDEAEKPAQALPAAPNLPMPKVLVVDDQPDNLLAMSAVLATLDQELVTVNSGRDALRALLDHDDFAVIIMDVQMPLMDGYETAAQIKRRPRNRDVPIIFLTAMGTDPEHSARGYAAGGVDFISKPFDPWALRAKVAVFTAIHMERRLQLAPRTGL